MDIPLAAAERNGGNTMGGEPIGVEAAVGNGEIRFAAFGPDGLAGRGDARLVAGKPKRFVIELAVESDGAVLARGAAGGGGGPRERLFDFFDDSLTEFRLVTAGFGAESDVIGNNVRGLTARDHADVARALTLGLIDSAVPAILHQVGDCQRCDRDRAHTFFGPIAG